MHLRYVILPSAVICAARVVGEYNITATIGSNITFAKQKYHADTVSISLIIFWLFSLRIKTMTLILHRQTSNASY